MLEHFIEKENEMELGKSSASYSKGLGISQISGTYSGSQRGLQYFGFDTSGSMLRILYTFLGGMGFLIFK